MATTTGSAMNHTIRITTRAKAAVASGCLSMFVFLTACVDKNSDSGSAGSSSCVEPTGGDDPLLPAPKDLPEVEVQAGACAKLDPEAVSANNRACTNYLHAVDCCYEPNPWADNSGEGGASTSCLNSLLPEPEGCIESLALLSCAADLAAESCEQFHIWRTFITHGHVDIKQSFSPSCGVPEELPCHDETVAVAAACVYGFY